MLVIRLSDLASPFVKPSAGLEMTKQLRTGFAGSLVYQLDAKTDHQITLECMERFKACSRHAHSRFPRLANLLTLPGLLISKALVWNSGA
ncbi:hypothetical protein J3458_004293 [Metarhizium acridum]|uniref:uncharacterized protein n=1 Tax=Metarhizium acridum TaxID=92637 RepID=UPI001C6C6B7C|nr:hypothetical protein J3458_004293 [Metarhizium acridum]